MPVSIGFPAISTVSLPYKISTEKDGNWAIRELKATSGSSVRDPLVGSKRICESHKAAEATFWIDAKKQMAPPALYRGHGASGQKPLDFFHPMEIGCFAFFFCFPRFASEEQLPLVSQDAPWYSEGLLCTAVHGAQSSRRPIPDSMRHVAVQSWRCFETLNHL